MFQAKGNSFMSKNLRKYIMARLIKKGLYMKKWIKSFKKVNWSKDKKKEISANERNYFGKFLLCKDNQIIFDETMVSHYLAMSGSHWHFDTWDIIVLVCHVIKKSCNMLISEAIDIMVFLLSRLS